MPEDDTLIHGTDMVAVLSAAIFQFIGKLVCLIQNTS